MIVNQYTKFTNDQKLDYIREHTTLCTGNIITLSRGMHLLTKDMNVFKTAHTPYRNCNVIVNLVIPANTFIFLGTSSPNGFLKCRAERAFVHSQCTIPAIWEGKQSQLSCDRSVPIHRGLDVPFLEYVNGQHVYPNRFSQLHEECAPGIHFFVTLYEAFNYI